ncbi:lasso peptide biosynthesis B2 protein (plasmid) [Embleya sp. NBC_00888]|uniref:lasso peptide biosynthesis B2 protein n=1 Tax=Embleya sp. NBC_00888 TaxID=2975960 RepID=UPI00386DE825|nr:lasso peptide biosynthesis B2 protein [Embleya sp. NBC_00888]
MPESRATPTGAGTSPLVESNGIGLAAHPHLGGNTACLPRALAAFLFCRSQCLAATVVIGVADARTVHTWLEAESRPAGEASDPTGVFTPTHAYGAASHRGVPADFARPVRTSARRTPR